MKKILLLLLVGLLVQTQLVGQTGYQLRNSDFEQWETVSVSGSTGEEPVHWNSHIDNQGSWASTARAVQIEKSTDVRVGATGIYSCVVKPRSVIGVWANGLVTTGRVNAGSISASNSSNHNVTLRGNDNFNAPFYGKPDSVVYWAKFVNNGTREARMQAFIHGNFDCTDPLAGNSNSANYIVGQALREFPKGNQDWNRYAVAFDYNKPHSDAQYMLITFTTNKSAGGSANANDRLYVDDIEMIYNVNLTDLLVGGVSIPGFQQDKLEYTYYLCPGAAYPAISHPPMHTYSPRAEASTFPANIFNDGKATIRIKHSGWHPDSSRVYTVNFVHLAEPVAQPVVICGGGETTLSVTPVGPTARWYNAATDGTLLATGNSYTSPITESTTFYVSSYDSDLNCESARVPLTVTVNPIPSTPTVTPVVQCGGGEINLSAIPGNNGNQCRWYANASSTEILASANTYSPTITESSSYFVSTYNTTTQCESERVELTITINPIPASPIVEPQSLCAGNTALFTPTDPELGATYIWSLGAEVLGTADTYTTSALSETTTYTVKSLFEATNCQSAPVNVTVTVFPVYNITLPTVTACDEHVWNGNTYTASQQVSHTFESVNDCDSTVSFELIINYTSPITEIHDTICQGETYTLYDFNIATQDKSGLFEDRKDLKNSTNCDSVVLLYLMINLPSPVTTHYDTICQGESYNKYGFILPEQTVANTHFHTAPLKNAQQCDSTVNLYLTVLPVSLHEFSAANCSSYTWNESTYTASGDYKKTFEAANGCDSIVTLHLTINMPTTRSIYDTICQGETYTRYNFNISTEGKSGLLEDRKDLISSVDCDSVVLLYLMINQPSPITVFSDTICQGETYTKHGFNLPAQNMAGDITREWNPKNATGCDSIIQVNLFVLPISLVILHDTILMGSDYHLNGFDVETINKPGIYTYINVTTAGNSHGCDSTTRLRLVVLSTMSSDTSATACESYTWFGTEYTESGDYQHAFSVIVDDDSIVTLHLTINNPTSSYIYDTICIGTAYQKHGFTTPILDFAKTYTYENPAGAPNSLGCDSTIVLSLTVLPNITHTFKDTACISYTWDETTYNTSGSYDRIFSASNGCDSIVTLQLTINQPSPVTPIADVVCFGDAYEKHGFDLPLQTQVGTEDHFKTWKNQFGCDSVVKLTLTVLPKITHSENKSACVSHTWKDKTYTESGDYQQTFTASNGCDSIVTLHLTINQPTTSSIYDTICQGEAYTKYNFNINTQGKSGVIEEHLTAKNSNDCDSIVTLYLTVNEPTTRTIYDEICQGEIYSQYNFNINTQGESGVIERQLNTQNSNGCDSIVTLHLTINQPTTNYISDAACAGTTYQKNGFNLELDGTEETIVRTRLSETPNVFGCDSTVHLTLTVLPKIRNVISHTACDSYLWNDITYYVSGSYEQTFTANNGCDSIVTLNLTITHSSQETVIYDATCQGETYTENGFDLPMQIQVGTHIHTLDLVNEQGCDSTITLHLTVNRIYVSEITHTACNSYEWIGETYTESGVYPMSYKTINGCDSTITLRLTINQSSPITEYIGAICQGEDFNDYDFELPIQEEEGTFVHTKNLKNESGCDSIVTLTLTVHPVSITRLRDTIFAGETYTANGFNIETSSIGAYRDTLYLTSSFGCDSTVILVLIANNVSINQYVVDYMVELFPNPASYDVTIRTEKEMEKIEIFNVDGKLVETVLVSGATEKQLNISSYAKGFYFVKITTDAGPAIKKLIIQ